MCSFRQKTEIPDWISIYYMKSIDPEGMKCSLCDVVFDVDEKNIALLEHMKTSHLEIYNLHITNPEANVGFRIEFLQVNVLNDEIDAKTPILLQEICEDTAQPKQLEMPDDSKEEEYLFEKKKKVKPSELNSETRRRSWVWKYFDRLSKIIYRCNLCNSVLSIKGFNTNNMNRHVRSRHPIVYKQEVRERAKPGENFDLSSEFGLKSEEIITNELKESDQEDDPQYNKKHRSWIWSYFDRLSATQAQCKLCKRQIRHGGNATGNMNRHLKICHNKTSENLEFNKNKSKWVWKVFEECDDDGYSCKICQFRCEKATNERSTILSILTHLRQVHGVVSGDQIITGMDCEQEED